MKSKFILLACMAMILSSAAVITFAAIWLASDGNEKIKDIFWIAIASVVAFRYALLPTSQCLRDKIMKKDET